MKRLLLILNIFVSTMCFSQGIQSEKYFLFENMCDQIQDSIYQSNKNQSNSVLDSLIKMKIIECTIEYVNEISKSRFTYPYRKINKNYVPLPNQTELMYSAKHYNITDENINSGFAEQYPYYIFDSIMYDAIISKFGNNIFTDIKKSSDSLIKERKGYFTARTAGRKKQEVLFKEIFNSTYLDTIKCNRGNIIKMTIESNGECKDIELIALGWHGRTMPSDCDELKKRFAPIKEKLLKLKWKAAEFEGHPMKSELTFNFHEFGTR